MNAENVTNLLIIYIYININSLLTWFECILNTGSQYDQEPLFCQFCEDFSPQKATCMCSECTFTYCGTCFDTYHPMKGPLSGHTIGPPEIKTVKKKESNVTCQEHKEEKVALYCHECQMAVCYMCKEFGQHKKHQVELLDAVFRKTKVGCYHGDDFINLTKHFYKGCSVCYRMT